MADHYNTLPDIKESETDFQASEQNDENRLIVEAKIPYADLEVLMDLGEGTFGQVKLVYDKKNPENIMAVKVTDLAENKRLVRQCKREALTLRALRGHPNIINYLSMRLNDKLQFQLFMDYADGGELFDQIEPDVGLSPSRARHFFIQLIDGLLFIHSKGITHRDIKPENLLLTKEDVLKICDFGFATVYRNVYSDNTEETFLTEPIGTPEYGAPEVFARYYRGEPVDVWSAGVVLVVMMTGDMPWEEPTKNCPAYYEFAHKNNFTNEPWTRIGTVELSLIRQILTEDYDKRITLAQIRRHPWVIEDKRTIQSPIPGAFDYIEESQETKMASTQPANFKCLSTSSCSQKPMCNLAAVASQLPRFGLSSASFSQPNNADSLMLSMSQLIGNSQQGIVYHPVQSLVRRMTRFVVSESMFKLIDYIEDACSALGCSTQFMGPHQILVSAMLRRRQIRYVLKIYEFDQSGQKRQLVDARHSQGNGMDFKRAFAALRQAMNKHVCKESDNWLRDLGLVPAKVFIDIATSEKNSQETSNDFCIEDATSSQSL